MSEVAQGDGDLPRGGAVMAGLPRGCRTVRLRGTGATGSHRTAPGTAVLSGVVFAGAEQGGAGDPDLPARQLSLAFDGVGARAGIRAGNPTGLVAPAVTTLLDSAGVR